MYDQMKQMMEMKKKFEAMMKEMEKIKVERTNSSKTLAVTVNGAQKIEGFRIDASWFVPERKAALETSLTQLVNEAMAEAQKQMASQQAPDLLKNFKGLNIPGL